MRILCLYLILQTVHAQIGFGTPYLKNSRLCRQWNCLNNKLCMPDTLPSKDQYIQGLKSLLPDGAWQEKVVDVGDVCYGNPPRRYSNTCPGQALMHCTIEQLIENCPEDRLRKEDACAPVSSFAGFKYLFSQSRYENLENNLQNERRPSWFLKNYFNRKCCNLPEFFNSTVLDECGITRVMFYHVHEPHPNNFMAYNTYKNVPTTPKAEKETLKVVELSKAPIVTPSTDGDKIGIADINTNEIQGSLDPLSCCDVSDLIKPSWRSECDFRLTWDTENRLTPHDKEVPTTTEPPTTTVPNTASDLKIVPLSCEKETCIFKNLNIINDSGTIDTHAFSKLLDNMTDEQPVWSKAKARVVTKCLIQPLREYDGCEINKLLACTFDVLSENCPYAKKDDPCKHSQGATNDIKCQVSSSKYRPRYRRQFCGIPSLVPDEVLSQCGVTSLTQTQVAPPPIRPQPRTSWRYWDMCKDSSSTKCLMTKMGVNNKYGYIDYFALKEKIRHNIEGQWPNILNNYVSAWSTINKYNEYCSSTKLILYTIDSMLMTCPLSRRNNSTQCTKVFQEISAPYFNKKLANGKVSIMNNHFSHVFLPYINKLPHKPYFKRAKIVKKPLYSFGLLGSENAPPVNIIKVKPVKTTAKPKNTLTVLPVYMQLPRYNFSSYGTGILRNTPVALL